jgi:hypothetical protein
MARGKNSLLQRRFDHALAAVLELDESCPRSTLEKRVRALVYQAKIMSEAFRTLREKVNGQRVEDDGDHRQETHTARKIAEAAEIARAGRHPCGCMVGTICPHRCGGEYCDGKVLVDGKRVDCPECSPHSAGMKIAREVIAYLSQPAVRQRLKVEQESIDAYFRDLRKTPTHEQLHRPFTI